MGALSVALVRVDFFKQLELQQPPLAEHAHPVGLFWTQHANNKSTSSALFVVVRVETLSGDLLCSYLAI